METVTNSIQKVKVKDGQLEATYDEHFSEENYTNTISKKCSQIIHVDFRDALDKLKAHMACICEMPEAEKIRQVGIYDFDDSTLGNYVVTGYSHGGSDESAGVVIVGQKLLNSGKVLNLCTPFIQFEDDEAYPFAGELNQAIIACDYEAGEYLFDGKYGIKQLLLDFDAPADVEITTTVHEEKPKRRKRKKELEPVPFDVYA